MGHSQFGLCMDRLLINARHYWTECCKDLEILQGSSHRNVRGIKDMMLQCERRGVGDVFVCQVHRVR
jgi:hypothetical protein